MNPITSFLVFVFILAGLAVGNWVSSYFALVFFAIAVIIALSLKMANAWQKFIYFLACARRVCSLQCCGLITLT